MVNYRIYCLDGAGSIGFADWIAADSDEEAMAKAHDRKPDAHRCEIWLGNKLIAKLNGTGSFERFDA